MSEFNAFQAIAAAAYADGEFADLTTMEEVADCGDGLFRFVMVELSSSEDCCTADEALTRMHRAIRELGQVHSALL